MTQSTPPSNKLETEPVGKLLWQYAVPAIVGTMVMSLYTIIDRIFIGQGVGPDAISGLALTFPIMNLTAAVGNAGRSRSIRPHIDCTGTKRSGTGRKNIGEQPCAHTRFSSLLYSVFHFFYGRYTEAIRRKR